jgi:hypothetical protein
MDSKQAIPLQTVDMTIPAAPEPASQERVMWLGQEQGKEVVLKINGSPTATKKPKKTKQTKSKINSKETTPDTANSPK